MSGQQQHSEVPSAFLRGFSVSTIPFFLLLSGWSKTQGLLGLYLKLKPQRDVVSFQTFTLTLGIGLPPGSRPGGWKERAELLENQHLQSLECLKAVVLPELNTLTGDGAGLLAVH